MPEARHQPGMTVARQALAAGLLTVVLQVLLRQPAFQPCSRIHPRRGMRLKVDQVATLTGAEEMVVAHLEQIGDRCIGGEVPAQLGRDLVGMHHHRERVPAHQRADPAFDLQIAGVLRLVGQRNGVAVGCVEHRRHRHAQRAGAIQQLAQDEGGALGPLGFDDGLERVEPLTGFDRVEVGRQHRPVAGGDEVGEVSHQGSGVGVRSQGSGVRVSGQGSGNQRLSYSGSGSRWFGLSCSGAATRAYNAERSLRRGTIC